jgi:hypothetical protein
MEILLIGEKESNLAKTIEFLRDEMIHIGIQEGLTNEKTIRISQKLDTLIAKYQSMKNQKSSL